MRLINAFSSVSLLDKQKVLFCVSYHSSNNGTAEREGAEAYAERMARIFGLSLVS